MRLTSNIERVEERMKNIQGALQRSIRRANVEVAKQASTDGKNLLQDFTATSLRGHDRWGLSGQASANMGGPHHNVDDAWRTADGFPQVTAQSVTWTWENANPIFRFLNEGTRDHGPREASSISTGHEETTLPSGKKVRGVGIRRAVKMGKWFVRQKAKRLFIPLNYETAKAYLDGQIRRGFNEEGSQLFHTESFHKGKRKGQQKSTRTLVWGVDFVLAKRVKGIQALEITKNVLPLLDDTIRSIYKLALKLNIQEEIAKA